MYVDWEYYKIFIMSPNIRTLPGRRGCWAITSLTSTHTMNKLEDQLHCVLFIPFQPGRDADAGRETRYARIASAAVQIQDAEAELSASATLEHGAIGIQRHRDRAEHLLVRAAAAVHAQYPGIRLRLSNHSTPRPSGRENWRGRFRRRDHPAEPGGRRKWSS